MKNNLFEGKLRIRNNDVERYTKCDKCGEVFWAKEEYEMGNFVDKCGECSFLLRKEWEEESELKRLKDREEFLKNIRRNGKPIESQFFPGKIVAYDYGNKLWSVKELDKLNDNTR